MNALTEQDISIVSPVAGTTTDAVEKAYELPPLGPVVFIDTAGTDDMGELGLKRVERSMTILEWVDAALVVLGEPRLTADEEALFNKAASFGTPVIAVCNKTDIVEYPDAFLANLRTKGLTCVTVSAKNATGIDEVREALISVIFSTIEPDRKLFEGAFKPGDTVLLVTPMDTGAPKGRLILPQVQAIREILDAEGKALVVKENRVKEAIENLKTPPALVVTDSQVVGRVCKEVDAAIPMTTFSIELAYAKSDLKAMVRGLAAVDALKPGDRVLIAETCSHNPLEDDIGRVKIPALLKRRYGEIQTDFAVGKDFPDDLSPYRVIIQCGGCMVSRKHMLARLRWATSQSTAMTNYGVILSFLQGALPRALGAHPEALAVWEEIFKR